MEEWPKLLLGALKVEESMQFKVWLGKSAWQWSPSPQSRLEPQVCFPFWPFFVKALSVGFKHAVLPQDHTLTEIAVLSGEQVNCLQITYKT